VNTEQIRLIGGRKIRRPIPGTRWVHSSTDYKAGELFTHGQSSIWIVGRSDLAEALLKGMDPHADLASTVLGVTYDEFLKNKKVRRFSDARQATKCFHPDTEVLTRRGWMRIGEVTYEDEIAAATPGDGGIAIEWQRPTNLTRRSSPGSLIHLKNEGMNLRVTDDHRMLVQGGTGKWSTVIPEDVARARSWYNAGQCATGSWAPDERVLRLAVATQADGSFCNLRISFGFKKTRKMERLESLLRPDEYVKTITSQGATAYVLKREITSEIRALLDDDKQFTWAWLELTPALRDVVLAEVPYWDGHKRDNWRMYKYSTARPKNADVLQAMAAISNRKTRLNNEGRQQEHHSDMWSLSVRAKPDTRGENLEVTRIAYTGDVVCLSVPASYVVARDGGIPVIVGQCFNFGKPGGMGDPKLVLQQRKQGPDTPCPNGNTMVEIEDADGNMIEVPGYKGLRFCILMGAADRCGERRVQRWGRAGYEREIPPTCLACLQCAAQLGKVWKAKWRENERYFKFVEDCVQNGQVITSAMLERWPWLREYFRPGQRLAPGQIMQHVVGRLRQVNVPSKESPFCSASNGFFQALLSDITKRAYWRATRECHDNTIRIPTQQYPNSRPSRFAGGPSPLLGSHIPGFYHDELYGEHPEETAPDAAWRIAEIMEEEMMVFLPDVAQACLAEPALQWEWNKAAANVIHDDRLVVWTSDHNPKKCAACKSQEARDAARKAAVAAREAATAARAHASAVAG
jgi:hypothetical protein